MRGKTEQMSIDETDGRIVRELSQNGRDSFRTIASKVGLSPATLIERVKRLEGAGIVLGYSACINHFEMGYSFAAIIEVTIRKGALLEVQKRIAALPGVVSVYDVTGEYDSIVVARVKSRTEFSRLVKRILALEHVERTNTHVVLNVVKENERMMPNPISAHE
ncbi:Lrp/AsnC family transcriptional regulator [Candidatus Micrarchaeota archaeon]|nr:Lrp/AsnC family transcriptional regulator [Candidatus Micrarchaeota archaeon]MBI5177052.1 Lrp/AsnC family transcriptional regulator [Candidatus Micrarchaeota archaeon]